MTKSLTPLLLYLEDAPLRSGVAGAGLSKAFNATLRGLLSNNTRLCIVQTHTPMNKNEFIDEWCTHPAWAAPKMDWVFARLCARLPWPLASRAAELHGHWIAWRLRRALPNLLPRGTRMLAPVGVDPLTLVRGESVARHLSAKFEPYLVDDIESHPGNDIWHANLRRALTHLLQSAVQIFSISDGLGDLLRRRHAVQPRTLHLVAAPAYASSSRAPSTERHGPTTFAFFLGSINHLYTAGLKQLIREVAELRESTKKNLIVRLSSSAEQVRAELGELPLWVVVGPIADHEQLCQEIAAATFCFLPYSFAEEAKSMVVSSFPSKMINYLAHANAILVLAPENSVPYRLLSENGMPNSCSSPDRLRELLYQMLQERPNLGQRYRHLLDQLFSVTAMRRTLGFRDNDQ